MFLLLSRHWGMIVLRGFLYILLACVVFAFPTLTLDGFIALLSTFLLTDGFLIIWVAAHQRETIGWKTHLLEGVTGIIFGWLMLFYPHPSIVLVLTILSGWAMLTGIIKVWSALHMSQDNEDEFWLGLSGVFGVAFGVLMLLFPVTTHSLALTSVGGYSLLAGTILSIVGLSLRQHLKELRRPPTQLSI